MDYETISEVKKMIARAKETSTEELPSNFTKIGEYNDIVFGAKEFNQAGLPYQFVSWRRGADGGFNNGDYGYDYEMSKQRFLKRSELNQQYKRMNLLTYKDIKIIASGISLATKVPNIEPKQIDEMIKLKNRIINSDPRRKLDIGKMFDESELFLMKAGLIKAGISPDLDNATRKGIGQIVEKIEGLEEEVLDEFVYDSKGKYIDSDFELDMWYSNCTKNEIKRYLI